MATEQWRQHARIKLNSLQSNASSERAGYSSLLEQRSRAVHDKTKQEREVVMLQGYSASNPLRYEAKLKEAKDELGVCAELVAAINKQVKEIDGAPKPHGKLFYACEQILKSTEGL